MAERTTFLIVVLGLLPAPEYGDCWRTGVVTVVRDHRFTHAYGYR